MGLDMYLIGEVYLPRNLENPNGDQYEDGYRLKSKSYDIGYWRKHPDLHGFIVENFAGGVDDCRPVDLSPEQILRIIAAVNEAELPRTTGFFFGESYGDADQRAEDIAILSTALQWLQDGDWRRSIYYRASW